MTKKNTYANRGMTLEKKIINKCKEYEKENIAFIYKIPTEFTIIRKGKQIISAFPKKKSIIDFMGCCNDGQAIAIEAKSTTNSTSFPFSNIAEHQWDFFEKWCTQSKGYYLIWFKTIDKYFLVDAKDMQKAKKELERKSVPLQWFDNNTTEIHNDLDFIQYI